MTLRKYLEGIINDPDTLAFDRAKAEYDLVDPDKAGKLDQKIILETPGTAMGRIEAFIDGNQDGEMSTAQFLLMWNGTLFVKKQ